MPLAWLLTAHYVGDFLCQTDWMAQNKSRHLGVLALHALAYTGVVTAALLAADLPVTREAAGRAMVFFGATYALHFAVDAVTSRLTSALWFVAGAAFHKGQPDSIAYVRYDSRKRHWFFCAIGLDQLLHAWSLALVLAWGACAVTAPAAVNSTAC